MAEAGGLYREVLDSLSEGVYFVDREGRITLWNKGAERLSGFRNEEVSGRRCNDGILNHVDKHGRRLCGKDDCPTKRAILTGQGLEMEMFIHHKDGHRVPVLVKAVPIRDENNEIVGSAEAFEETSSRPEYERQLKALQDLALIDPLTTTGNRRYGEMQLKALMNELGRYRWPFGVLFMDIDHFKAVNDTYGHETGDLVLQVVAQTLLANTRSFDHVSRWGGEEFIVLLVNMTEESLAAVAEKLRALVASSTLDQASETLRVTVSIGATVCKSDDTIESLLKRADALMYRSKNEGRNRVTIG